MEQNKESQIYNRMADYYDKYRPAYPQEIIDTIVNRANLTSGSNLLEIGAGSGKATVQFADLGIEIVCVEPGAELCEKGRENFKGKSVTFVNELFENYSAPREHFDAIISAQAFHWVPQPLGYEKCAEALKNGGKIAMFWNIDIIGENAADKEFFAILNQYSAFTACIAAKDYEKRVVTISSAITNSRLFAEPEITQSFWDKTYSADEYFQYLLTGHVFVQKTESDKQGCYGALKKYAERHGGIRRRYVCELYIAEKL